ncbi:MAG: GtrA family protein [Alphaproteobacteria bacterium]|nr:GtrA family protein [Alphaproteobacteria bacterium]
MIATLLNRHRRLGIQVMRFGIIGVTSTTTHIVVVLAAVESGLLGPLAANLVGFFTSAAVSYLGNHKWTFELTGGHLRHITRFIPTATIGLSASQSIVYVVVNLLGRDYRIALAVIVVVVPTITFLLNRFWAFRAHPASAPAEND